MTPEDLHREDDLGKVVDARLLRRLLGYVSPYRLQAAVAVALIVFSSVLQLVGPLLTAVVLDVFVRPSGSETARSTAARWAEEIFGRLGWDPSPIEGVTSLAACYVLVLVATFVVLYAQSWVMQIMGQEIMYDLRREIFGRLQRLSVSDLDRQPVGRLVTRATTDVAALNELFTAGLVSIFGDVVLLVGIVSVLFALDWRLALVSLAIVPLLGALTLWFKTRARESYREVRVKIARINAFLQEHVGGMSIVQLFGQERRIRGEFREIDRDHRDANVRAIFYYAVYYPAVTLITSLGLALIVWYGGGRILLGTLSIGALVAFLQYAQRFYQPLADLSEKYNILQAAMASSERIFELLDREPRIVSPPDAWSPERIEGRIELDRVRFSYVEDEPVLRDVSFRIEPGETVAIVGHTGAGKSTLANLILRFYDVDSGAVRVDGRDVREWDLDRLRGAIAMVLQDVFLFSGSVGGNIGLGQDLDLERLRWAAGEVHALEFIERLPDGFEHLVHERGGGLSVGQKQLVAFARALAFDPRILILDEATASIDTETEQKIQAALGRLLAGRTSVVIAHRLSTIRRADRILVLHRGVLREQGTHQELLEAGGIYHKLWSLQAPSQIAAVG